AVKRRIADGSVGFPHVRVGHRQAPNLRAPVEQSTGVFLCPFTWENPLFIGVPERRTAPYESRVMSGWRSQSGLP
ncbi:hypothetical protein KO489_04725, partial [Reinekea forsetii]|nr:hypothetical protein [Reinekea forsetii]